MCVNNLNYDKLIFRGRDIFHNLTGTVTVCDPARRILFFPQILSPFDIVHHSGNVQTIDAGYATTHVTCGWAGRAKCFRPTGDRQKKIMHDLKQSKHRLNINIENNFNII